MVLKEKVAFRLLKFSTFLLITCFTIACSDDDTYAEKVNKLNEEFVEDKKELLTKVVVHKLEDSLNSGKSIKKINDLERDYENKLNELNDLFLGQEVIAPFEIKKTTEIELAQYGMQVDLNIKNRTVFNVILKEFTNWLIKMAVIAIIVFIIGFFVNYTSPFALFKVIFSHPIVFIIFGLFSYFLSPAKYFGLIASDLENETEKIISVNIEKTENAIEEIKTINIKNSVK